MTNNVRELMLRQGLKPSELAHLCDLTPASVYRILDNSTQSIDIDNLVLLCASLQCEIADIYPSFEDEVVRVYGRIKAKRELL